MAEASKTTFTEDQTLTTAHCPDPSETVDENLPQPEVNEAPEEPIEEPVVEEQMEELAANDPVTEEPETTQ